MFTVIIILTGFFEDARIFVDHLEIIVKSPDTVSLSAARAFYLRSGKLTFACGSTATIFLQIV